MYSAGVLLYSIIDDEIYFLLGKDSKWKQWSDFGGKNDPSDAFDFRNTASREFYEETMGVVFDSCQILHKLKDNYIKSLSFKQYDYYMFTIYLEHTEIIVDNFKILYEMNLCIPSKYKEKMEIKWISLTDILDKNIYTRGVFYKTIVNNLDSINNLKECVGNK